MQIISRKNSYFSRGKQILGLIAFRQHEFEYKFKLNKNCITQEKSNFKYKRMFHSEVKEIEGDQHSSIPLEEISVQGHISKNAELLSSSLFKQLMEKNYAVIDNILNEESYQKLLKEIKQCVSDSNFDWLKSEPSTNETRIAYSKHLRAKTLPYSIISQIIYFFTENLPSKLNKKIEYSSIFKDKFQLNSDLASNNDAILALYEQEGYYSKHLDCIDAFEEGRRISLVYYITDTDWDPKVDGGKLKIYPNRDDPHYNINIDPIPNRLVAFISHLVPFEVHPPKRTRLSLNFWLSTMIEKGDEEEFNESENGKNNGIKKFNSIDEIIL